jgi:plasmid replication initiation protein
MATDKNKRKNTGIKLIKKANKLVESRYKFDIWETRVFLSVLAQINKDDEDFTVYRIWYKDVIKAFNLKSAQSYDLLRTAAKELMRKVFYVTNVANGVQRETEFHIIRSINYLKEGETMSESQDYLDITIDPEMKPLLLQLGNSYKGVKGENFTSYDLQNVVKLGAYHIRIYELLKQYQKIGCRTLKVAEIRRMLEITTEYPLFGSLYQKVIKPSVKAINKYTDLNVTNVEKIKEGRRVAALRFEFIGKSDNEVHENRRMESATDATIAFTSQQKPTKLGVSESDLIDVPFEQFQDRVVQKFGVTPIVFLKLTKEYNKEQIEQAIRVTNRANFNQQIKSSIAGFFINALKEGYTDQKEEAQKKAKIKGIKQQQSKLQKEIEHLKEQRAKAINDKIRNITERTPEVTEKAIETINASAIAKLIIEKKELSLGRKLMVEDYRQDKILRDFVKGKIIDLYSEEFNILFAEYDSKLKVLDLELELNGDS